MTRLRLPPLLLALVGLLIYAWVSDRPSPAEPRGSFWAVIEGTVLIFVVVGGPLALWWLSRAREQE